jgi:manganese/zinc/iron transport system permease protein
MSHAAAIAAISVLCAAACSAIGVFLVLRRMAMLADAISHSILPGLVAGFILANGPNLGAAFAGAVASGLATVGLVEALKRSRAVSNDAAIGLVFPAMFSLGVVIISRSFSNLHLDTDAVLYGEIAMAPFDVVSLGGRNLGPQAVWILAGAFVLNLVFVGVLFKELKLTTFDPDFASTTGFRPAAVQFALMVMVSITTVAAFSAVGAILSVAMLVTPAATAALLTRRLNVLFPLALVLGAAGGLAGYGLAAQFDVSISGMIAAALGAGFVLAVLFAPEQGMAAQVVRRSRQRLSFACETLLIHLAEHRGTTRELEESSRSHLTAEFGWTEPLLAKVLKRLVQSGLVKISDGHVELTERGLARAYDLRNSQALPLTLGTSHSG